MFSYIMTQKGVTVYIDYQAYTCDSSDPVYAQVVDAIKTNNEEQVKKLLMKKEQFKEFIEGSKLTIDDLDVIYYEDQQVPMYVAKAALNLKHSGFDVKPITNFIEKLMQNPVKTAIEELYQFMEVGNLPITPEGNFLAYKLVRSDYKDIHSGTFDNSVGKICEMPLDACNTDRNQTCSSGLHFCSKDYLSHFGDNSSRLMILEISPADVVSIPSDYNNSKGRCRKYKVVAEIPNGRTDSTKVSEFESTQVQSIEVKADPVVSVPAGMKKCTKCGTIKSLEEYHNDSKSKDGKKSRCKECTNEAKRKSK